MMNRLRNIDPLDVRVIGLALVLVAFGFAIYGYSVVHDEFKLSTLLNDFYANVSAELGSIAITVLIIDVLSRRRDKKEREEAVKEQLIREAGSKSHDTAIRAVEVIRKRGWLRGEIGILQGADLRNANLEYTNLEYANLQDADLRNANLQNADLRDTDLQGANLEYANLQGANLHESNLKGADLGPTNLQGAKLTVANLQNTDLQKADLRGAHLNLSDLRGANLRRVNLEGAVLYATNLQSAKLRQANLQDAKLSFANLRGAKLSFANLQGAYLVEVNLQDADMTNAKFNEQTTLPDDTNWTPDTDMTRYTDPNHSDFWRSDDENSPAHRGKRKNNTNT